VALRAREGVEDGEGVLGLEDLVGRDLALFDSCRNKQYLEEGATASATTSTGARMGSGSCATHLQDELKDVPVVVVLRLLGQARIVALQFGDLLLERLGKSARP
jgi:hypothetical protein